MRGRGRVLEGKLICLFYTSQQSTTGMARQEIEGRGRRYAGTEKWAFYLWKFDDMP
jgi:hypothetical protein